MKKPGVKTKALSIVLPVLLILLNACRSHETRTESTLTEIKTDSVRNNEVIQVDSAGDTLSPAAQTVESNVDSHLVRWPLKIMIKNLASPNAPIIVGVYGRSNKFPDPNNQFKIYKLQPNGKDFETEISDLKFGTYALAIYQDVNDNGKIDKNLIGVPTEPYAFSNNFKPTVKAPVFDNCKFDYDSNANTVTMKMIR